MHVQRDNRHSVLLHFGLELPYLALVKKKNPVSFDVMVHIGRIRIGGYRGLQHDTLLSPDYTIRLGDGHLLRHARLHLASKKDYSSLDCFDDGIIVASLPVRRQNPFSIVVFLLHFSCDKNKPHHNECVMTRPLG